MYVHRYLLTIMGAYIDVCAYDVCRWCNVKQLNWIDQSHTMLTNSHLRAELFLSHSSDGCSTRLNNAKEIHVIQTGKEIHVYE